MVTHHKLTYLHSVRHVGEWTICKPTKDQETVNDYFDDIYSCISSKNTFILKQREPIYGFSL